MSGTTPQPKGAVASNARIRRPVAVVLLSLVTCGLYSIYWWYAINRELRDLGRAQQADGLGRRPVLSALAFALGWIVVIPFVWTVITTVQRVQGAQRLAGVTEALRGPPVVLAWCVSLIGTAVIVLSREPALVLAGAVIGLAGFAAMAYMQVGANRVWRVAHVRTEFDKPRFLRLIAIAVYLFLFAPILVVILFSFNSVKSLNTFDGFSLQWYEEFLNDPTLRESLFASLEIAFVTMLAATVIGTALAIGLVRSRARWAPGANILMLVPLVVPEIVAGISALLIFSQIGIALSFWTIVIAHITFSISYVTIVVRARMASITEEVEEAAMDLGATRWQSVRLVLVPALWPSVLAAGLLVFAFSFDDFVLSFFTTGEELQPLPVRIWSAIRFGLSPTINAIGTLMMVVSLTAIGLAVLLPRLFGRRESGLKVLTASEG